MLSRTPELLLNSHQHSTRIMRPWEIAEDMQSEILPYLGRGYSIDYHTTFWGSGREGRFSTDLLIEAAASGAETRFTFSPLSFVNHRTINSPFPKPNFMVGGWDEHYTRISEMQGLLAELRKGNISLRHSNPKTEDTSFAQRILGWAGIDHRKFVHANTGRGPRAMIKMFNTEDGGFDRFDFGYVSDDPDVAEAIRMQNDWTFFMDDKGDVVDNRPKKDQKIVVNDDIAILYESGRSLQSLILWTNIREVLPHRGPAMFSSQYPPFGPILEAIKRRSKNFNDPTLVILHERIHPDNISKWGTKKLSALFYEAQVKNDPNIQTVYLEDFVHDKSCLRLGEEGHEQEGVGTATSNNSHLLGIVGGTVEMGARLRGELLTSTWDLHLDEIEQRTGIRPFANTPHERAYRRRSPHPEVYGINANGIYAPSNALQ